MNRTGLNRRCAIAVGALLLLASLVPSCGGGGGPALVSLAGNWTVEVDPADCIGLAGLLDAVDGPEQFLVTQDGDDVSASFIDSAGNQVSVTGKITGMTFRGMITIEMPGIAPRTLVVEGDGAIRMEGATTIMEGELHVASDTDQTCTDTVIGFRCTVDDSQQEPPGGEEPPGEEPPPPEDLECGPLDVVLVMDSSTSMYPRAERLCDRFLGLAAELAGRGVEDVSVALLGALHDAGERPGLVCLEEDVWDLLGPDVPGTEDEEIDDDEDWGPAAIIVAARYAWRPGATRVIITLSDEAPQNGGGRCSERDLETYELLRQTALDHGVVIYTMTAFWSEQAACVFQNSAALAAATGGIAVREFEADVNAIVNHLINLVCE